LSDRQTTREEFGAQQGTVGWQGVPYSSITVDLERVEAISGVALHAALGTGGVRWPRAVLVLASDNGQVYRLVGDLVELDHQANASWPKAFTVRRLAANELSTRGRFVRMTCPHFLCRGL